jgi:hypothetical protein
MGFVRRSITNPYGNKVYRDTIRFLYRHVHGLKSAVPLDDEEVVDYKKWLIPKIEELWDWMPERYPNPTSRSTKMIHIASVLLQLANGNTENKLFKKWNDEAIRLRKEATKETGENLALEDFVPYDSWVKLRETWKDRYEALKTKTPKKSRSREYYAWLSMACMTMQPPLRTEWGDMKIIRNESLATDNNQNYLWVQPGGMTLIINKDKVSKTYGTGRIPVEPALEKVVRESLDTIDRISPDKPRAYVIPSITYTTVDPTKPIGKEKWEEFMRETVAKGLKRPIQNLRAAYATEKWRQGNMSYNQMMEMAKAMRHGITTSLLYYNKRDVKLPDGKVVPTAGTHPLPEVDIESGLKKLPMFDRKAWRKAYYDRTKESRKENNKSYYAANRGNILRKKLLRELNANTIKTPNDATLKRYGVRFSKSKQQWVVRKDRKDQA